MKILYRENCDYSGVGAMIRFYYNQQGIDHIWENPTNAFCFEILRNEKILTNEQNEIFRSKCGQFTTGNIDIVFLNIVSLIEFLESKNFDGDLLISNEIVPLDSNDKSLEVIRNKCKLIPNIS